MMADPAQLTRKIRTAFQPCRLGAYPTPLDAAPALAAALGLGALSLKREDRTAAGYGGNKVRGLEFLFAGAPAGATFLTIGGTGSTHCLAVATHAPAVGARAVVAQFPQPDSDTARACAAATLDRAAVVRRARTWPGFPPALAAAWIAARRLGRVRWIPGGGAAPQAVIGHFLAGLELGGQVAEPPAAILLPLGTGGTAAGLALAMATLEWPTALIAARVAPRVVANRWRVATLARRARGLLARHDVRVPPASAVTVVDALGRGYGHPTPAGERARALAAQHGLMVDPTYGAKAFGLAFDLARAFRSIVFWHTFAAPPEGRHT